MKSFIVFLVVYTPAIFTIFLLFSINYNCSGKPIISKKWRSLGYCTGAYTVVAIAALSLGLDSLPYFETEEAKELRKYNISNLVCWVVTISLLRFENAYLKDR